MSNFSYYSSDARLASTVAVNGSVNPVLARMYHDRDIRQSSLNSMMSEERAGLCENVVQLIETTDRQTDREMAADILLTLLRHAEKNLKQALAARLATIESAPLRLILQFINDEIDVAEPVLKYSKALNDLDLLYIIQSRDPMFWRAIAVRQELGEAVVEALVDTKDTITNKNLIHNLSISFSDDILEKLVRFSEHDDLLSQALLDRSNSDDGRFVKKIYAYAGEALKETLQTAINRILGEEEECQPDRADVVRNLADVLTEFIQPDFPAFMPTPSMVKAANMFAEQGKLVVALMVGTLKRGQAASFIAQFSRYAGLPVAVVIPMLQQKNGRGFAVAAKASGVERNDFMVMYSYTRKIMGDDYLSSSDITAVLAYYDRVTPEVAKRIMTTDNRQSL